MPFADAGRIAEPLWIYCILIVMAVALFLLARNFIKSRPGRALIAVRDNQTSASISGVNLALYKAMAFGVSAAFGGLAGTMLMINRPFASDVQFGLNLAIFLVVGLVAGGAGTISGAVPGALIYVFVPYFVGEWTLDQTGMPPGIKQATKPLFNDAQVLYVLVQSSCLARHRPEDARADRLELGVQQHRGVGVELDHRAVGRRTPWAVRTTTAL